MRANPDPGHNQVCGWGAACALRTPDDAPALTWAPNPAEARPDTQA